MQLFREFMRVLDLFFRVIFSKKNDFKLTKSLGSRRKPSIRSDESDGGGKFENEFLNCVDALGNIARAEKEVEAIRSVFLLENST